jgi:hypothetical protein
VIALAGKLGAKARPLAPALLRHLQDSAHNTRAAAATALLAIDHKGLGPLVDAAIVKSMRTALQGGGLGRAIVFGYPGEPAYRLPRTAALVGRLLKDGTYRLWGFRLIWVVGPDARSHLSEVERAVEDQDDLTCYFACEALKAMGLPDKAHQRLLRDLSNERDVDISAGLLAHLGPAPPHVVQALRAELRRAKGRRRVLLAGCLWKCGGKVEMGLRALDTRQLGLDALIEALGDKGLDAAVPAEALAQAGPEAARAVPALVRRLKSEKWPEERLHLVRALGKVGPAAGPAVKLLLPLLNEPQSSLQLEVARALHRIRPGHPLVVPALQKWIRSCHDAIPEYEVRLLGEMGRHARGATPLLVRLLRHRGVGLSASAALWKVDPALARKVGAW